MRIVRLLPDGIVIVMIMFLCALLVGAFASGPDLPLFELWVSAGFLILVGIVGRRCRWIGLGDSAAVMGISVIGLTGMMLGVALGMMLFASMLWGDPWPVPDVSYKELWELIAYFAWFWFPFALGLLLGGIRLKPDIRRQT